MQDHTSGFDNISTEDLPQCILFTGPCNYETVRQELFVLQSGP